MNSTVELKTLTPSQIDTLWSDVQGKVMLAVRDLKEAEAQARRYAKAGWQVPSYITSKIDAAKAKVAQAEELEAPFKAEWTARGGWTQYIRCMSDGGHIHYSHCHTLTPGRTLVALVPDFSGMDATQVVDAAGYHACTFCFPEAPTTANWIAGQKAAAEAAKAKEDAKCAGSGKYVANPQNRLYVACPVCGKTMRPLQYGNLRAHAAEKAS